MRTDQWCVAGMESREPCPCPWHLGTSREAQEEEQAGSACLRVGEGWRSWVQEWGEVGWVGAALPLFHILPRGENALGDGKEVTVHHPKVT